MEEKLANTIEKIQSLANQNAEFKGEMRKLFGKTSSSLSIDDERINQIYEYCIEKVIHEQAKEFYKDFPLSDLTPSLENDFVRMEFFRRKNNFGDFCLALYQQIECITNALCSMPLMSDITRKLWGYPAYVYVKVEIVKGEDGKEKKIKKTNISARSNNDHYSVAKLLFGKKTNENTGTLFAIEKSRTALKDLQAMDKIKVIIYFLGFQAMMKWSDFDFYIEFSRLLEDIYQCRNLNHRGNTPYEWQQTILDRIIPLQSYYYFKFLGVLAQFIDYIKTGYPQLESIKEYTDTLVPREVK